MISATGWGIFPMRFIVLKHPELCWIGWANLLASKGKRTSWATGWSLLNGGMCRSMVDQQLWYVEMCAGPWKVTTFYNLLCSQYYNAFWCYISLIPYRQTPIKVFLSQMGCSRMQCSRTCVDRCSGLEEPALVSTQMVASTTTTIWVEQWMPKT